MKLSKECYEHSHSTSIFNYVLNTFTERFSIHKLKVRDSNWLELGMVYFQVLYHFELSEWNLNKNKDLCRTVYFESVVITDTIHNLFFKYSTNKLKHLKYCKEITQKQMYSIMYIRKYFQHLETQIWKVHDRCFNHIHNFRKENVEKT